MSKKKPTVRIIAVALKTRADAERVVREIINLQLDRECAIAQRDRKIVEVSAEFNQAIDSASSGLEEKMAVLEQWAAANPEEFPAPLKSTRIDGHAVGWRLGNYAAATLKGFTWPKVVAGLLKSRKRVQEQFLRVKTEANKEALIQARNHPKLLKRYGVEIVQGETFYLDPAREGQPDATLVGEIKEAA